MFIQPGRENDSRSECRSSEHDPRLSHRRSAQVETMVSARCPELTSDCLTTRSVTAYSTVSVGSVAPHHPNRKMPCKLAATQRSVKSTSMCSSARSCMPRHVRCCPSVAERHLYLCRPGRPLLMSVPDLSLDQRAAGDCSAEALDLTTKILTLNPEFQSAWAFRRRILQDQLGRDQYAYFRSEQAL